MRLPRARPHKSINNAGHYCNVTLRCNNSRLAFRKGASRTPYDVSSRYIPPPSIFSPVCRNARRCRVNDAIAENYTQRGRASYSYTLESFRYYSLLLNNDLRGFLCFLSSVLPSAGAATVTKCTPALVSARLRGRQTEGEREREKLKDEGTSRERTLARMHLRRIVLVCPFSSFALESSSTRYPLALVVRSFLALRLTININLKSVRESIEITGPLFPSVFASSLRRARWCTYTRTYVRACTSRACSRTRAHGRARKAHKGLRKRGTFAAYYRCSPK